jgi:GH24 family phage-related lysozyme (muramidase)/peptidoglycan hydrolase-like protein with peptidoglycan-binding domain
MDTSTVLRKGQHGPEVKQLQAALKAKGYGVGTDGVFGAHTELAVIALQRRNGLLPDGIAGPRTRQLLGLCGPQPGGAPLSGGALSVRLGPKVGAAAAVATVQAPPPGPSKPASAWSTSEEGLQFLYVHEAQRGVSNHLHWPGGDSGVTLGPGYDMGGRSADEIARDLTSVGVADETAKAVGNGAKGLTGQEAKEYAHANKKLVDLSEDAQAQLLRKVVPKYESHVRACIHVDIFQYQFDALVSFDYNCGGRNKVYHDINHGHVAEAMDQMRTVNTSGGKVLQDLITRREHEITLYLYGKYAKSAV